MPTHVGIGWLSAKLGNLSTTWWENTLDSGEVTASRLKIWPVGELEPSVWLIDANHAPITVDPTELLLGFDYHQQDNYDQQLGDWVAAPIQIWVDNVDVESVQ